MGAEGALDVLGEIQALVADKLQVVSFPSELLVSSRRFLEAHWCLNGAVDDDAVLIRSELV